LPNLDRITVERTFGLFDRRAVVWAVEASQTSTAGARIFKFIGFPGLALR
jgi:hypothetical protein